MRVFGVVAEFDPFHAGHALLLRAAREAGADAAVAVMSGSFVQRGQPAVLSKFDRAADAVCAGFDLVIELPVRCSLSSGERFSALAVRLLAALGICDTLFFGSESGDLPALEAASRALCDTQLLARAKEIALQGRSYPAALEAATCEAGLGEAAALLRQPNNVLALGYLAAIRKYGLPLAAATVRRLPGAPSAHRIREDAAAGLPPGSRVSPQTAALLAGGGAVDEAAWSVAALSRLREMDADGFARLPDTGGGLAQRLASAAGSARSFEDFCARAKTKRYTMSRVKRAACRAVLALPGESEETSPYARLLAIGARGQELLARMKRNASVPFSESLATLAETGERAASFAAEERRATDLYNLVRKTPLPVGEDLTRRLYVVK